MTITFYVSYFEAQEGGMDSENYGETVSTIEEAIHLLELAMVAFPSCDWVIVCDVSKNIRRL
jgi:hypothetical protein